ncbi:autophagy protein 13 [Marasmius crinis-equi]|uniref:Autophagy-related protein 13 n=1 Tax=Marasmius crinis-equi TaxID=585013 RepID=A0ABR3EW60_9AGAR
MSNDTQKADQIALHFYTKLFYVVNDARNIADTNLNSKIDKWFNLETPDSDLFTKEAREPYRSLSSSPAPPPLEIQVLLTIPDLTNNQVLVYQAPDSSRVRVEPTPKSILLESFVLAFTPRDRRESLDADEHVHVALPTIYKHGIPLFRSLYSLLRISPAWKLCKRLRRRGMAQVNRGNGLGVQVRVREAVDDRILEFDVPPSPSSPPLSTSAHAFPSVPLPMGSLTLTSTYLTTPNFKVDELESLLSSNFMSLDVGPEFTPTLVKNQQRDSLLSTHEGSPGSLPMRISLPLSPPREISRPASRLTPAPSSRPASRTTPEDPDTIADRFVLPSRTASASSSPPLPSTQRTFPITRATTTTSTTTSTPLLAAARLRKESLQRPHSDSHLPSPTTSTSSHPFPSSSTASIPPIQTGLTSVTSQTSPISVRRPGLSPVNPFKSNTVMDRAATSTSALGLVGTSGSPSSFSSSLRNQVGAVGASPMSSTGLPSLPNFPRVSGPGSASGSGTGSGIVALPPHSPAAGSSFGSGTGVGGSRPSPPFAPSSLGDRSGGGVGAGSVSSVTGGGGAAGEIPVPTTRKRYSSSFGHRYSSVGSAGSGGSGGSGAVAGSGDASPSPRTQVRELAPLQTHSRTSSLGQMSVRSGVVGGGGLGAGGDKDKEREATSSFLSTPTDDDDISVFVQDIDARKPLIGRSRTLAGRERQASLSHGSTADVSSDREDGNSEGTRGDQDRERTVRERETQKERRGDLPQAFSSTVPRRQSSTISSTSTGSGTGSGSGTTVGAATIRPLSIAAESPDRSDSGITGPLPSSPPAGSGPMLTTETEVDEKLRRMNEAFLASLEGLGGSSRTPGNSSPTSASRPSTRPSNFLGEQSSGLALALGSSVSPSTGARGSRRGSTGSPLHNQLQLTTRSGSSSGGSEEVLGRLDLGSGSGSSAK